MKCKNYKGIAELKERKARGEIVILAITHCSKKWMKKYNITGYPWWLAIYKVD